MSGPATAIPTSRKRDLVRSSLEFSSIKGVSLLNVASAAAAIVEARKNKIPKKSVEGQHSLRNEADTIQLNN